MMDNVTEFDAAKSNVEIKKQFDRVSRQYDAQRHTLVPCFDDFYAVAVENLNFPTTSSPRILDLGAGTGLLSQKILELYPKAQLTLVDLSEKMLDIARLRFEGLPNVTIKQADFTTFEMEINSYDAIVSSLAIHHLTDDNKRLLYNRIHPALKPDGLFVNAEQILADNDFMQNLYHKQWCNKIEHSTLSRQEINASYERIKLDKRATISAQLNWLKDAGFSQTDCLYKYYYFAVLWAMK